MHRLAVLSMRNRALIALVTVVVAVFGAIALSNLRQELVPDIQFPELAILTTYQGASPEVVENDVSDPVEASIQNVENLTSTSAVSNTGQSIITAQFNYGTDLDTAEQKLDQAINNIQSTLPSGVTPQVFAGSFSELPVVQLAVSSSESQTALGNAITSQVLPTITKLDGVSDAELVGEAGQRITITPDASKLAAAGLTDQSISTALSQNGALIPGGTITQNGSTLSVESGQQITSVAQVAALPLIPSASAAVTGGSGSSAGGGSAGVGSSSSAGVGSSGGAASQAGGATGGTAVTGRASASTQGASAAATATSVTPQTIGSVATVALADNPATSLSRVNGKDAVTIAVTKLPSANTVAVSKEVRGLISSSEAKLGHNAKITVVFDQAPFIQQSISSLAEEGALGLLFAVVIILLFLLSVRSTLVTAISIPTSVFITFIAMWGTGYTLNIITLGALTIAIGRVVDDSIVVVENIKRHLVPGADRARTILEAVREVAGAISASTLTTVAVFLPLAFVGDVAGELFRPFAVTVTIALLSSLLVALTIVPVLAYWFVRAPRVTHRTDSGVSSRAPLAAPAPASLLGSASTPTLTALSTQGRVATAEAIPASASGADASATTGVGGREGAERPTRLQRAYLPIIHWTLRHSIITVVLALIVLIGTAPLVLVIPTNYLGSSGQNTLTITQTLKPGASLAAQNAAATVVEKKLLAVSGVKTVQLSVGSSGSALRDAFTGGGGGITFSVTTDESRDQTRLQNTIQSTVNSIHGEGTIALSTASTFGSSNQVEIDVTSPTQADLQKATDEISRRMQKSSALTQVSSNLAANLPFISVNIDRTTAAQLGLSEAEVGSLVSQAMSAQRVGTASINGTSLTIYLQNANPPTTLAALAATQIPTATGDVRLDSLASVSQSLTPASITTSRGERTSAVTATPTASSLTAANAAVQKILTTVALPSGTTATVGGVGSNQTAAFGQLALALLAAILIVYIVMVATFRSLLQPLLLLVSVPFAATGALALQVISGVPLGLASIIGLLMLVGIVVTNAIVLIDLVNQYRGRGLTVPDAIVHGASRRLRPILMTALATIFALVPMASGLTGSGGGFISQPLAITVIGGLVSSTVLTLVVLPTLYNLVIGSRERRALRRALRAAARADDGDADGPGGPGAPTDADALIPVTPPAEDLAETVWPLPVEEAVPAQPRTRGGRWPRRRVPGPSAEPEV